MTKYEQKIIEYLENRKNIDEYLDVLIGQFNAATGEKIKRKDLDKSSIRDMFVSWLYQRKKQTEDFRRVLRTISGNNKVDKLLNTCEIGKGVLDSLVTRSNASVISPFANDFDANHRKMLFKGNFMPRYRELIANDGKEDLDIGFAGFDTFIILNPYDNSQIGRISDVHNSGIAHVVYGFYGSNDDRNRKKIDSKFDEMATRFTVDPCSKFYADTINHGIVGYDTYYYVLSSKDTERLTEEEKDEYREREFKRIRKLSKRIKGGKEK